MRDIFMLAKEVIIYLGEEYDHISRYKGCRTNSDKN